MGTGRVPRGTRAAHSGRPEMQPTVRIETLSGFKKKKRCVSIWTVSLTVRICHTGTASPIPYLHPKSSPISGQSHLI